MGLLLCRTHLNGENSSPQSSFYINRFAIRQRWRQCNIVPRFLPYSFIWGEGDNPGNEVDSNKNVT